MWSWAGKRAHQWSRDTRKIAQWVIFGWIGSRSVQLLTKHNADSVLQTNFVSQVSELDNIAFLKNLGLAFDRKPLIEGRRDFEDHFDRTTSTQSDGRYFLSFPYKTNIGTLCECKTEALKRFFSPERKLKQDVALCTQYRDFVKDFRDMGHSELVPPDELAISEKEATIYPTIEFCRIVSTTKLRVYFDDSALTSI